MVASFPLFILQIDQKITSIVSDQQKADAKRGHHKSELEQLKQDIANATKQRMSISKSLEKKVSENNSDGVAFVFWNNLLLLFLLFLVACVNASYKFEV